GVAARAKVMSFAKQRLSQGGVVIELAIENDADVAVLIRHRLMPAGDVDDAQTTDAERDTVGHIASAIVRTAMCQRVGHGPDDRQVTRADNAGYPAHNACSSLTAEPPRANRLRRRCTSLQRRHGETAG